MTLYYFMLGFEALLVLLVTAYLFRKILFFYRNRRERKQGNSQS